MNKEMELILPDYIDTKKEKIIKRLLHVDFMVLIAMFFNLLYEIKNGSDFISQSIPFFIFGFISIVILILTYFVKREGSYSKFIKQSLHDQGFSKENAKAFHIELDRPYLELVVSNNQTNELYKAMFDLSSNKVELKPLNLIKKV